MTNVRVLIAILFTMVLLVLAGCSSEEDEVAVDINNELESEAELEENETGEPVEEEMEEVETEDIQLTEYADEIGFTLDSPTKEFFDTETMIDIQGSIEETEDLQGDDIWIIMTRKDGVEGIDSDEFNVHIPIDGGNFSEQLALHHGEGEYEVRVRVPSNKPDEENRYYDVAVFDVMNHDQQIQREIEYTQYGVENEIQMTSPELGWNENDESIYIEGTVPEYHEGEMVLVQVEKEQESRQLIMPIDGDTFSGEVPLYFGEGIHHIRIQTFAGDEDYYYDSAMIYVDNQSSADFAEMEKYNQYIDRGITLQEPTWSKRAIQNEKAYRITGEIDPEAPGADDITHIIVTVENMEEAEAESGYLIPVENYQFDGEAYFRFGPGNYEVLINVPELDQRDQSMFFYEGIMKAEHEVVDIEDERGLLPSRGIESDHPAIIEKAEEITAGLDNERDKAKAIYKFVSQHVAYDVEKAENNLFNLDDSAVSTLNSGVGVCQDYAFLATALFRAIGMESHYVEGYAGERHAWVEVMVDGEWLEMDPTWGAGYVQNGEFVFQYNEDYFDPDQAFLEETHRRDGIMY